MTRKQKHQKIREKVYRLIEEEKNAKPILPSIVREESELGEKATIRVSVEEILKRFDEEEDYEKKRSPRLKKTKKEIMMHIMFAFLIIVLIIISIILGINAFA